MVRRKKVTADDSPSAPRTWGYFRVSTRQQADVGHSLEDQKVRIAAYATANDLPRPTEIFVDAATSGTVGLQRREAGKRMLDIAQRGDHIIVTKGDRLFRSAKNALEISELLRHRGIALHCQELGGEILNSPTSRLMFGMMMLFATIERDRIAERTSSVKETQTSLGFYIGGKVPVGFEKSADGRRITKKKTWDKHFVVIKKRDTEGLTIRAIADRMTADGTPMSRSTVYRLLTTTRKVDAVAS
jgi:DNA invertase Pin-like site-specific DNA recombinase